MVEVNIKLSDEIAHALGDNEQSVARRILENAAIESYRAGRLSQRQVGQMLGLDYWQTEQFLAEHHVLLNYRESDFEADLAALPRIFDGK